MIIRFARSNLSKSKSERSSHPSCRNIIITFTILRANTLYFYWIDTYPLFSSVFLGGWQWPLRLLHFRFELGEAYSKKGPLRICQVCKATFRGTSHTEPVWIMRESLELFKSDKRHVGRTQNTQSGCILMHSYASLLVCLYTWYSCENHCFFSSSALAFSIISQFLHFSQKFATHCTSYPFDIEEVANLDVCTAALFSRCESNQQIMRPYGGERSLQSMQRSTEALI